MKLLGQLTNSVQMLLSGRLVNEWELGGTEGRALSVKRAEMGDPSTCTSFLTTGISFDGGFAEYMVVPIQALSMIPYEQLVRSSASIVCR
jgi:propanol-preferring alcohol dehydrogenase